VIVCPRGKFVPQIHHDCEVIYFLEVFFEFWLQ